MKKENRNVIVMVAAVAAAFFVVYGGIVLYAGTTSPLYTVESGSMMHSEKSRIGIIDTGDMVIAKDPSKTKIVAYVDGYQKGYKKFGDHGDVILFSNPGGTVIIHRAIVFVEYNGGGTWNIPSLAGYDASLWECGGTHGAFSGTLVLKDLGFRDKTVTINLNALSTGLPAGTKGYITMGDNNTAIDPWGIVTDDMIVAVAAQEIPWLGCIKLLLTGNNTDNIPANSIISLVITITAMVLAVVGAGVLYDRMRRKKG